MLCIIYSTTFSALMIHRGVSKCTSALTVSRYFNLNSLRPD